MKRTISLFTLCLTPTIILVAFLWFPGSTWYVADPISIRFSADRALILPGQCAALTWSIDTQAAVYLNETLVETQETQTVCPASSMSYTLRVESAGSFTFTHYVRVLFSTADTWGLAIGVAAVIVFAALVIATIGDLPLLSVWLRPARSQLLRTFARCMRSLK